MKIDNRRKKKYSSKIFNELSLLYLVSNTGYFYEYEAYSILKISERTLYRYLEDIKETYILGLHSNGLQSFVYKGNKLYHYEPIFFRPRENPLEEAINPAVDILPIGFVQKHPKGLDSSNKHIVRLTRCTMLMHHTKCIIENDVFQFCNCDTKQFNQYIFKKCYEFYYDNIGCNVNIKTFNRDMMLIIDVLKFIVDK